MKATLTGFATDRQWGSVMLLTSAIALYLYPPGVLVIIGCILFGALAAAIRIKLYSRGKLRLAGRVVYLEMVVLLVGIFSLPKSQLPTSFWGFLGIGALVNGISILAIGLCEERINRGVTATFFGARGAFDEPVKVDPEGALKELPLLAPHPVWEQLKQSIRPCLRLDADEEIVEHEGRPISKLGGQPELPDSFEWPVYHGKPLDFLGQIRLDEAAAIDPSLGLPETGLLSIFFSAEQPWGRLEEDLGGNRVYLHPLETVKPSLQGKAQKMVPLQFSRLASPAIDDETQSTLWAIEQSVPLEKGRRYTQLLSALRSGEDWHQLMGHPVLIQGDMDGELAMAARLFGLPERTEWTLLLQLWSEPRLEWCWGDAGSLYCWIPTIDLAHRRFDRTWVILQCT